VAGKACHDRSLVSKVDISQSDQTMIAFVAVRLNIDDSFLSGEYKDANLDYVNEEQTLGGSQPF
jgi:hypothetical protein